MLYLWVQMRDVNSCGPGGVSGGLARGWWHTKLSVLIALLLPFSGMIMCFVCVTPLFLSFLFCFVFVVMLSLELCRCSSDLCLSSRPRIGSLATTYI